jgi:hypothetical protein
MNPAPFIFENGTVLLVCSLRNNVSQIGIAVARSWKGPYYLKAITQIVGEDAFVWRQPQDGSFHMLFHTTQLPAGHRGICTTAWSEDGISWTPAFATTAYTMVGETYPSFGKDFALIGGGVFRAGRRERHQLVFDAVGWPALLLNGATAPGVGADFAFTAVQPIVTGTTHKSDDDVAPFAVDWSGPPAAPTRHWLKPPSQPSAGRMPDGPLLGNGDLGVSVWADPARGVLVLYLGLNQMWGVSKNCTCPEHQPRCCSQSHTDFYDTVFPRRLAAGGLTLQSDALNHSNFSAALDIGGARANATLATTAASLSVGLFLAEDANTLVVEVTTHGTLGVLNISTWVDPLAQVCQRDFHKGVVLCEALDGAVHSGSGVADAAASVACSSIYASRQPLSAAHSPQPVVAAIATSIPSVDGAACGAASATAASWVGRPPLAFSLLTSVVTRLDLCGSNASSAGCTVDPLPVAAAKAARHSTASPAQQQAQVAILRTSHDQFWEALWSNSSLSLPTEPATEAFWYTAQWLLASASRPDKVAPGLWGPWVHTDSPGWEGVSPTKLSQTGEFGLTSWGCCYRISLWITTSAPAFGGATPQIAWGWPSHSMCHCWLTP